MYDMNLKSYEKISDNLQEIEERFKKIDENVMGTKKYWEGISGEKYRKHYEKMQKDIPVILNRMREKIEGEAKDSWKGNQIKNQQNIDLRIR